MSFDSFAGAFGYAHFADISTTDPSQAEQIAIAHAKQYGLVLPVVTSAVFSNGAWLIKVLEASLFHDFGSKWHALIGADGVLRAWSTAPIHIDVTPSAPGPSPSPSPSPSPRPRQSSIEPPSGVDMPLLRNRPNGISETKLKRGPAPAAAQKKSILPTLALGGAAVALAWKLLL